MRPGGLGDTVGRQFTIDYAQEHLVMESAQDWCPWCGGETGLSSEFCSLRCMREYHADLRVDT